jgi:hypothetical protein
MKKHTVKITNEEFAAAYQRFLAVMGLKDNWTGILEFIAMFGVDSLSFKKDDDGELLYRPDTAAKLSKLCGENGTFFIQAYKARRATPVGALQAWVLRFVQPVIFLPLFIRLLFE